MLGVHNEVVMLDFENIGKIIDFYRINSRVNKLKKRAVGILGAAVQGRKRSYNSVSEDKLKRMMEMTYEQRSEAKIRWAVKAYNDWRTMRLDTDVEEIDEQILYADLNDIGSLTKTNFEHALCRFICEVRKTKEVGDYPGATLYQMACALQNFIKKKELNWRIVHGDEFTQFNRVLDKVMQERADRAIGTVRKQAEVISIEFENKLWENDILGEQNPDQLRNTVLYMLGVNCALRAGDEHYGLRRPGVDCNSQLTFEENSMNVKCLVYREDRVTKTNRGGLRDMKKERKIVWIKPNKEVKRCPVRLVGKYLSLVPKKGSKPNFYLHSMKRPTPTCWYNTCPLGINKVRSAVSQMLKDAGLDGFFTNHSLRRTAATRLFRAGKDVKLVKEITGHVSNAVEKYEITSDQQRMELSSIIQGEQNVVESVNDVQDVEKLEKKEQVDVKVGNPGTSNNIANGY